MHDSLQETTRQQLWMHLVINAAFPQNKRNSGVNVSESQHLGENNPKVILWQHSFLQRERETKSVTQLACFFLKLPFFPIGIDILDAGY